MTDIKIFNNDEFGSIRTIEENGNVLFSGTDIAKALGYSNTREAISRHCRYVVKRDVPHPQSFDNQIGMIFIPEGDVYRLIVHSRLPSAERFERWVFDEVLPSVRTTGMFATPEAAERIFSDPDFLIRALEEIKAIRARNAAQARTIAVQNQQLAEMKPKAGYYDVVLNCKDLVAISTIAKDYGWSARRLNTWLHEQGVQFRQGEIWLLYQKYAEKGYTQTKTYAYPGADGEQHTRPHTHWTQKGRLFIYSLLKDNGVLPLIEKEAAV